MVHEHVQSSEETPPASIRRDLLRPHFKKDSRFVGDLYTITFNPEDGEELEKLDYLDLERHGDHSAASRHNPLPVVGSPAAEAPRTPGLETRELADFEYSTSDLAGYAEDDDLWRQQSSLMWRGRADQHLHRTDSTEAFQSLPAHINAAPQASRLTPCDVDAGLTLARHQILLQEEARLALAQARRMARWQMEVEQQNQTTAASQALLTVTRQLGADNCSSIGCPVDRQQLSRLSWLHLQQLLRALQDKAAELNGSLLVMLVERDELLQEQDRRLAMAEDHSTVPRRAAGSGGGGATARCLLEERTEPGVADRRKQRHGDVSTASRQLWRAGV